MIYATVKSKKIKAAAPPPTAATQTDRNFFGTHFGALTNGSSENGRIFNTYLNSFSTELGGMLIFDKRKFAFDCYIKNSQRKHSWFYITNVHFSKCSNPFHPPSPPQKSGIAYVIKWLPQRMSFYNTFCLVSFDDCVHAENIQSLVRLILLGRHGKDINVFQYSITQH